jgi:hypothetical protein
VKPKNDARTSAGQSFGTSQFEIKVDSAVALSKQTNSSIYQGV